MSLAKTPPPPYYAVIFTSIKKRNIDGYYAMSDRMVELVQQQKGFLGFESANETIGITVSYWKDEASILAWKSNIEHQAAQNKGIKQWYESYFLRVSKVERAYSFGL